MLMKTKKKNRKNLKITNFGKIKKGLEMQIGSFPQNLAWILAAVSEKPELMDGRLRHDSSSADRVDES